MSLWFTPKPVSDRESQRGENERLGFAVDAMQGWRSSMEDAHIAVMQLPRHPSFAMFAVMDGHGGAAVSKFCQDFMVGVLEEQLDANGEHDIPKAMSATFHQIDVMLRDRKHAAYLRQHNGTEGRFSISRLFPAAPVAKEAGSTAVVALLRESMLWIANAGDSRAVLCRLGKAIDLSQDHKPYLEGERARIESAGGWVYEGRSRDCRVNGELALSRAIGDLKFKKDRSRAPKDQVISAEPDVFKVQIKEEDSFIVLACDGVWDAMSSQAVVDFVQKHLAEGDSLSETCGLLLDKCLAKAPNVLGIGCDNMTAIIVELKHPAEGKA